LSIARKRISGHELAQITLFQTLDPAELTRLEAIVSRETFRPDTVVFFEGDTSDSLYGILSGSVKVFRTSEQGEERILEILAPGEVFGEYSLIDGKPRSAAVATLEESILLSISHRDFRRFVSEAPEVLWKVLESFTDRMRRQTREMMEFSRQDVPSRLASVVLKLAEKHGRVTDRGCTIALARTPESLAEMVASTADRVEGLLNRWASEGLIVVGRNELTVLDMKSLRRSLEYMKERAW
jgi:CRP-like cAMP-binding protein